MCGRSCPAGPVDSSLWEQGCSQRRVRAVPSKVGVGGPGKEPPLPESKSTWVGGLGVTEPSLSEI